MQYLLMKQQIIPLNITKEIIDETSILYREEPIYQIIDETGKYMPEDQKLWDLIMRKCRYHTFMDKLDRWTRLLGTVLVKVSFVDPNTGQMVAEAEGGEIQLDMLHGGVYDMKHGASPYYITELLIGFGSKFGGFDGFNGTDKVGGGIAAIVPSPSTMGQADINVKQNIKNPGQLAAVNRIYWKPDAHAVTDINGSAYETKNPYGIVPAIPFFNQDPAHYYFLPIDEPLIYANHSTNMRLTDLNHIAKFQSFGVPVISGVERPTSMRQGRPVDDFNILKGGTAQSKFGGIGGISGFAAGGAFRTFDAGLGIFRDGNADAAALGFSLGPDTAVAVGEKGDFKFAHPSADITGLIRVIESLTDFARVSHGLRARYKDSLPASGFSLMLQKIGVMEDNIRRGKLFKEREQQLFQIIKTLWNIHNGKSGQKKFSDKCQLSVTYKQPEFPVDPKTKMDTLAMENQVLDSGDRATYKKLYPHFSEEAINEYIEKRRHDKMEQAKFNASVSVEEAKIFKSAGLDPALAFGKQTKEKEGATSKVAKPKMDNKVKHSVDSSKKGPDPRK